jgi:phenylacetate-CoA ligase
MSARDSLERRFFEMLLESQWWSEDELRNYQRSQLRQLLQHAKANVPFYERRLDAVLRADGEIDWDRWSEIPIMKRSDIARHGEQMLARDLSLDHGATRVSSTSGTSGAPISLTSTELAHVALAGNRFRYYKWHDVDWTRDCCSIFGDDPSVAAWPDGMVLGPWGPNWELDALDGTFLRINRLTEQEKMVEFIARKRPAYLTTGPNTAHALALTAKRMQAEISLDAFLPHGASVSDRARTAIRETFGARSIDLYSSKEAGHIAHACPAGDGLHVNAESLYVEILDEEGRPVPVGVTGRVVLTTIFNAAQPLIRYDQGDLASWLPECSCGRHLPTISGLVGRSTTLFYHPDGQVRSAFLGRHRDLLHCEIWQVAQTGPTQFEVRYVPAESDDKADEAALAERIRETYFADAEVSFRRVAGIAAGASGKPVEYVNEWEPSW